MLSSSPTRYGDRVITCVPKKPVWRGYCPLGYLRYCRAGQPTSKLLWANDGPFQADIKASLCTALAATWGIKMTLRPARLWALRKNDKNQRRKRSPRACSITCPPTSEIDFVSGMSLGQTSTQFWA